MTPAPASRLRRAWWWATDYLYAGFRQLALLRPPWGTRRPTPAPWSVGSPDLPEVILLPGVYEHWTFLVPLGDALNRAGYRVSVVHGLGVNRRAVPETAERLGRALRRARPRPAGRVLVAHSKGGLIGKHLLIASATDEGAPTPDVIGMVAVCTPFGGSALAGLLWDPSIRAFLPSDETILSLGRDTSVNGRIVSVFGGFDPHIPEGSLLDGATNIEVAAAGHFRVLGQPETHRAVCEGIALLTAP